MFFDHLRLIFWFNIPKRVELIIRPKLFAVPNEPNFASLIFKDFFISFEADESIPLAMFITPSILAIMKKGINDNNEINEPFLALIFHLPFFIKY